MRISTRGRYALVIMMNLASKYDEDKYVRLNDIAKEEDLSLKYLEKIMLDLKKSDFFISQRGSDGGYKLKRKPSEYTVLEILKSSEGDLSPVDCIGKNDCSRKSICKLIGFWKELDDVINDFLGSKSLKDLMEEK